MNPSSDRQAGQVAALLAQKQLSGIAKSTRRRRVARAKLIAETIWKRWSVGVYAWKLKHCRWFLSHATREMSSNTKYQYWISLREMLWILGKERWLPSLRGPWCWPNGKQR